jgi:hypothetical protein
MSRRQSGDACGRGKAIGPVKTVSKAGRDFAFCSAAGVAARGPNAVRVNAQSRSSGANGKLLSQPEADIG